MSALAANGYAEFAPIGVEEITAVTSGPAAASAASFSSEFASALAGAGLGAGEVLAAPQPSIELTNYIGGGGVGFGGLSSILGENGLTSAGEVLLNGLITVPTVAENVELNTLVAGPEIINSVETANVPFAAVNQYTPEAITNYLGVAGILPEGPSASFVQQLADISDASFAVGVPNPQVAIPLPERTDATAILPTAVSFDATAPSFNALLNNAVAGEILGLGVPVADTVPEVATLAAGPAVNGIPALPAIPAMAADIPILTDGEIASLLVNHGVNSERVGDMAANVASYLNTAVANGGVAVANGMNSLVNSAAENWQNIANMRESAADLIGGIQRDQSTAVKEGLAALLVGAGESNEKTNLIAQALSNQFINTALDQQSLVNAGVNSLIKTNVGNMDNGNLIAAQLMDAFIQNQNANTPALGGNLNEFMGAINANMPLPTTGAVLNPGIPVGEYVAGAASAAVGNPQLDAIAAMSGGGVVGAGTGYSGLQLADQINSLADNIRTGSVSLGTNAEAIQGWLSGLIHPDNVGMFQQIAWRR